MKRPDSVEVVANVPRDEADLFLDTFKRHTVARSNIVPCTICTVAEPHTMRYQFLACASKLCERVTPGLKCSWRGQVVECSKTDETTVLECLSHASRYPDPKRDRLTTAQKVYIQEMTALRVKPSRIRNAMVQKLGIDPDDLPPLKKVQSYANYYRKTKLLNHDWYDEIVDYINAQAFSGGENDTKPFTFTVDQDSRGLPVVGIGSDADPFVVGITTKRLLSRLARPPESFVFHLDATYKLNQVGYPVLVCGISDRCRTFHLVALFVMSQQQEANTRAKALSNAAKVRITKDIYDMHFSRSVHEFIRLRQDCVAMWLASPETNAFAQFFTTQWLSGKLQSWQCFYTAIGFATTNNAAEQYNKLLKRDYTLRARSQMGTLLQQLTECCQNESGAEREFRDHLEPSGLVNRRVDELRKVNALYEVSPADGSGLEDAVRAGIKFIVSARTPRIFIPSKRRTEEDIAISAQIGDNYARMEVEGQSEWGWYVDPEKRACACRYFFKFGQCIHLLYTMQQHGIVDVSGKRTLVYRGLSRKRLRDVASIPGMMQSSGPVGHPAANGHALSLQ